jgi:hypothetical protein
MATLRRVSQGNFAERRLAEVRIRRILRTSSLETVWKLLHTYQTPHHEARHRHVDESLPCGAQPLVVLGHPPVMRDPREGALHNPPTR